jgi:hypothetical protein
LPVLEQYVGEKVADAKELHYSVAVMAPSKVGGCYEKIYLYAYNCITPQRLCDI